MSWIDLMKNYEFALAAIFMTLYDYKSKAPPQDGCTRQESMGANAPVAPALTTVLHWTE